LLQLAVRPLSVPGLKLGVSVFWDTINPYTNAGGDDTNPTHEAMGEHIFNAYAVYRSGPWEAIGEIFQINHELTSGPDDGKTVIDYSYYGQFGYRYHTWTPYVRYDRLQLSNDETYFSTTTDSRRTLSAGLRWDVATWNAIKVQYNNIHHDPVPAAAEPSSVEHQIAFQTAFAF
jgi:hypothetical protein